MTGAPRCSRPTHEAQVQQASHPPGRATPVARTSCLDLDPDDPGGRRLVDVAWALVSMADALIVLFVSVFSIAVLSPVVAAMERRLVGAGRCAPRCSC
jgi:hypothetical protein